MSVKASADTLRNIPIFADCDAVHLQVLAFSSPRESFAEGQTIIAQGQPATAGYLILSGVAGLWRQDGTGNSGFGDAAPGAFLGETAMISGRPYALTAIAKQPVDVVRIDRNLLLRVAEEYPEFGMRVFRSLARRLEGSLGDISDAKHLFDRARSFSNR